MNIIYRMFIYDFLYTIGDQLIKKYNPCQIHIAIDGSVACISERGLCCDECKHLGKNGCTVMCLMCKLHLCSKPEELYPDLNDFLERMIRIARYYNLMHFRTPKQTVAQHLKNTRTFRINIRGIQQFLLRKKT